MTARFVCAALLVHGRGTPGESDGPCKLDFHTTTKRENIQQSVLKRSKNCVLLLYNHYKDIPDPIFITLGHVALGTSLSIIL